MILKFKFCIVQDVHLYTRVSVSCPVTSTALFT